MTNPYGSESAEQHRQAGAASVGCAVLTVSDSRTLETDKSGQLIADLLTVAGHQTLVREIVVDDPMEIAGRVQEFASRTEVQAILITGGTGLAPRDQTPEAIGALLTKELPGYGELLRALSYQEIGPAAMLSRALGGLIDSTVVLTMPGSSAAVRLAMEKVILSELGHMVTLVGKAESEKR